MSIIRLVNNFSEAEINSTSFDSTQRDNIQLILTEMALENVLQQKAIFEQKLNVNLITVGFSELDLQVSEKLITGRSIHNIKRNYPLQKLPDESEERRRGYWFDDVKFSAVIVVNYHVFES